MCETRGTSRDENKSLYPCSSIQTRDIYGKKLQTINPGHAEPEVLRRWVDGKDVLCTRGREGIGTGDRGLLERRK